MSDQKPGLNAEEIRRLFEKHWIGSDEQLDEALEYFFDDIASSYELAMRNPVVDYFNNHYFE